MTGPALGRLRNDLGGAERVAVLTVGSEIHGDDAVGLVVGQLLAGASPERLKVFVGSNAPENTTGPIKAFLPTHLVIVDAAEVGGQPGEVALLDVERLASVPFTTHTLPLSVIVDYLRQSLPDCHVLVVGIEPESLEFGAALTPAIAEAAKRVADVLRAAASES